MTIDDLYTLTPPEYSNVWNDCEPSQNENNFLDK